MPCHPSRPRESPHRTPGDAGNAVVEFALVVPVLLAVALAVLQLALALHVRATLTSAAAEGARAAALAGAAGGAGREHPWWPARAGLFVNPKPAQREPP